MEDNGFAKRYKTIRLLGTGATAKVFLVEEIATQKQYAAKIGEKGMDLHREADWLKKWKDNTFPEFKEYYVGEQDYLIMEYIDGKNLQVLLDEGHRFESQSVLYIMEGVLNRLKRLHDHNPAIVYQDLKPANIMIEKSGRVRLLDLGAILMEGEKSKLRAGTYGYAAPEQFWNGVRLTKACDIYAAGKVLAYLLTGKNPAEPPYDMENYCKGLGRLHPAYRKVLERSLAYEAQGRYEDCESFRIGLREAFDEEKSRKKILVFPPKTISIYKKCIWKSEYRRIF